jgi:hypothetical protein
MHAWTFGFFVDFSICVVPLRLIFAVADVFKLKIPRGGIPQIVKINFWVY